jgi:hypothetical protein
MVVPPLTPAVVQRIEHSDVDYSFSRPDGMRQAADNPLQPPVLAAWKWDAIRQNAGDLQGTMALKE